MSALPSAHLTADDLDAFLVDAASPAALQHVAFCDVCRATVQADRVLVASLHGLPILAPADGFAERVMAQVRVAVPAPAAAVVPWHQRLVASRRNLAVAASTLLAMTASAAWTLGNRELFDAWTQAVLTDGSQWLWTSLQSAAATLAEQPWYQPVREVLVSPVRTAAVVGTTLAAWAGGVFALRRLVMLPTGPVPDARW